MTIDTPNSKLQQKRAELAADVERYVAEGGAIHRAKQGYSPIARGPDQNDFVKSASAAALLGFSQMAIKQSFRSGLLGGHPAPEFIRQHSQGHIVFMREALYQWVEKYGKGGTKAPAKKERAA